MDFGLKGRVALITGATRGLGLAIARSLATEGSRVAVIARTRADVDQIAVQLSGAGIAADLMTPDGRQHAFETTVELLGPVEVLINSFGARAGTSWQDTGVPELQRAMQGNAGVAAELTSMALPQMLARGWGRIVFVASVYGLEAGGAPAYNAAKAAEIAYAAELGASLAGTGVTANAVAPGPMLYEGGSWDRRLKEDPKAIAEFVRQELPAGRFGTPDEVGAVVCFLCSNLANGVNGACLPVDGAQSRSHLWSAKPG